MVVLFTNRVQVCNYFKFTSVSRDTYKSIYESFYFGLFNGFSGASLILHMNWRAHSSSKELEWLNSSGRKALVLCR